MVKLTEEAKQALRRMGNRTFDEQIQRAARTLERQLRKEIPKTPHWIKEVFERTEKELKEEIRKQLKEREDMEKVTVTDPQYTFIQFEKNKGTRLSRIFELKQRPTIGVNPHITEMSDDQIAAAWLGVAEIEPEKMEFEEGVKLIKNGARLTWTDGITKVEHIDRGYFMEVFVREDMVFGDFIDGQWIKEETP